MDAEPRLPSPGPDSLDPGEVTRAALADDSVAEMLDLELESLGRLVTFDLAMVWLLTDGVLRVRAARGPKATPALVGRTIALSAWSAPREAIEARRAAVHSAGSDAVAALDALVDPGVALHMATAPLLLPRGAIGILTVLRASEEPLDRAALDVVDVYGRLLAFAIRNVTQGATLERVSSHGRERISLLEIELGVELDGVLETSLSTAVQEVAWKARQVAPTDSPVLILGDTGTGKEWLARAIHRWGARAEQPFVKINCAAIPAGVLESELFGHVKGAFTGATRDRPGRFQIASGGTLLLDEIGELPVELQAKLLRVLQEGAFFPVGSDKTVDVDVRILAATHVDLERAIAERAFREDLFYRLSVFPLKLPPLRERLVDLPRLCELLLAEQASRTGRPGAKVTDAAMEKLKAHDWPGNLRELANVLERATILSRDSDLGPDVVDLPRRSAVSTQPSDDTRASAAPAPVVTTLDDAQRLHIVRALAATGGRVYGAGGAADLLGMKPSTLQSRMKKLGVPRTRANGVHRDVVASHRPSGEGDEGACRPQ